MQQERSRRVIICDCGHTSNAHTYNSHYGTFGMCLKPSCDCTQYVKNTIVIAGKKK